MQSPDATSIRRYVLIRDYHSDILGVRRTGRTPRKVLFLLMLRRQGIALMEIPAYSPDLNPIENVWSLVKDKLHKHYLELYLMRGDVNVVKKAIEEAITNCWEFLDPKVFTTLAGSMVDRIEAIIKADGWYTKY